MQWENNKGFIQVVPALLRTKSLASINIDPPV